MCDVRCATCAPAPHQRRDPSLGSSLALALFLSPSVALSPLYGICKESSPVRSSISKSRGDNFVQVRDNKFCFFLWMITTLKNIVVSLGFWEEDEHISIDFHYGGKFIKKKYLQCEWR